MRKKNRGLAAALFGVLVLTACGCANERPLYTAELALQTGAADEAKDTGTGGTDAGLTDETAGDPAAVQNDPSGEADSPAAAAEPDASPAPAQTEVSFGYVYVCGAVREPGVYSISADMRVCDAVALAGGFSDEADEEWLNQAAPVSDGEKLYVYTREETSLMKESGVTADGLDGGSDAGSGISASAGSTSADTSDGLVNLNTATREELMTLPGIGEAKADAILQYRSEHGSFASIEEIQNISGIKSGVFSKIKDMITV